MTQSKNAINALELKRQLGFVTTAPGPEAQGSPGDEGAG